MTVPVRVALMILLTALTAGACDRSEPGNVSPETARDGTTRAPEGTLPSRIDTVLITMTDGAISPSSIRLEVGRSTVLRIRNAGTTLHELMIGREPAAGSFLVPFFQGIAADFSGSVVAAETDAGRERHEASDSHGSTVPDSVHYQLTVSLGPSEEAQVAFVTPRQKRGEWEARCVTLDHFRSGERAVVIVER